MNRALEHIKTYIKKMNWTVDNETILEVLMQARRVWQGNKDKHRWWTIYTYVVELDGMFIGYDYAENVGDMSVRDAGYEFDINTVQEYEPKEIKTTIYIPKA